MKGWMKGWMGEGMDGCECGSVGWGRAEEDQIRALVSGARCVWSSLCLGLSANCDLCVLCLCRITPLLSVAH